MLGNRIWLHLTRVRQRLIRLTIHRLIQLIHLIFYRRLCHSCTAINTVERLRGQRPLGDRIEHRQLKQLGDLITQVQLPGGLQAPLTGPCRKINSHL